MKRLFLAAGLCGLVVAVPTAAADPDRSLASPTPAMMKALVEQLGAEQYADREAAAAALRKLGKPAIPTLETALQNDNPEIRERAAGLLVRLRRAADSAEKLAARRVKLDYADVALGSAINDLRSRTGLNIVLDPARVANPLRRVTCRTGELPVWEALEEFCIAAGLREEFQQELDVPRSPTSSRTGYVPLPPPPTAEAVAITLIDGKPQLLPGERSRAVRVLALPANFPGHKVTLGTGEMTLCFDVSPVPGLGWENVAAVKISRLIDSNGRAGSAGTQQPAESTYDHSGVIMMGGGAWGGRAAVAMRFDINGNPLQPETQTNPRVVPVAIKLNSSAPRAIRRLEGAVFAELMMPNQELIAVTDPATKTGRWFTAPGEVRFTVLEVNAAPRPGAMGSLKVQLQSPSPWALNLRRRVVNFGWPESPRQTPATRVDAFDAAGKRIPMTSNGYSDSTDDGMTLIRTYTLTFAHGVGVPAKLVVVGPKPVTVEVPFVLENIPLP